MAVGNIQADAAANYLIETIESCVLTATGEDNRLGFQGYELADQGGDLPSDRSRMFCFYLEVQGKAPWCWGGEAIEGTIKIVYQNKIIAQDLVDLKNHLENNFVAKAGIGNFEIGGTYYENNDIGESTIYAYMPVSIEYIPPES